MRETKVKYLQGKVIERVLRETKTHDIKVLLNRFLKQGFGPWQIATVLGVDVRTLHRWAKVYGVTLPTRCDKTAMLPRQVPPQALEKSIEVNTRWITWRGVTVSLDQAARSLGITRRALAYRLDNWNDMDRAMTEAKSNRPGRKCE